MTDLKALTDAELKLRVDGARARVDRTRRERSLNHTPETQEAYLAASQLFADLSHEQTLRVPPKRGRMTDNRNKLGRRW